MMGTCKELSENNMNSSLETVLQAAWLSVNNHDWGRRGIKMEQELVEKLFKLGCRISTAESCTGGLLAAALVDVPGASRVFEEGYITYSNRVKEKLLGVSPDTIGEFTVVSEEVAREMAAGVVERTGSELGVSVTGYAGPEDAEDGTKAGTVYIGTCFQGLSEAKGFLFEGGRQEVRRQAVQMAIKLALGRLAEKGGGQA